MMTFWISMHQFYFSKVEAQPFKNCASPHQWFWIFFILKVFKSLWAFWCLSVPKKDHKLKHVLVSSVITLSVSTVSINIGKSFKLRVSIVKNTESGNQLYQGTQVLKELKQIFTRYQSRVWKVLNLWFCPEPYYTVPNGFSKRELIPV
jgi:hypothetical protein